MGCCGSKERRPPAGAAAPQRAAPAYQADNSPVDSPPKLQVHLEGLVEKDGVEDDDDMQTCLAPDDDEGDGDVAVIIGPQLITASRQHRLAGAPVDESEPPELSPVVGRPFAQTTLPPRLACGVTNAPSKPLYITDWDFFAADRNLEHLRNGGVLFNFTCCDGSALPGHKAAALAQVINRSVFANEVEENNVPHLNMSSKAVLNDHIFVLQKSAYLLPPPLSGKDLTLKILSDPDFRRRTEPGDPKIWDDCKEPDTYRMTKKIIPLVYKITVQFRLSELPADTLPEIAQALTPGVMPNRAVLFERTKRDKKKTDALKKMKMMHLYKDLPDGGVLLVSVGCLVLSSLPKVLSGLVSRIGQLSGKDYADTATNIRRELLRAQRP
eukprot:TRINITY_DN50162_c0_g1_i1.p1 TRINITY_DN50162_c0_g1~~TRINITY_DN50162_c0_g1_i1.p1  ORF type:complete len:414 (+),score=100.79 TRINITY_DN50162_c0_g1_i1:97-1242(+)